MKKITAIVLAVALLLMLTACGGSTNQKESSTPAQSTTSESTTPVQSTPTEESSEVQEEIDWSWTDWKNQELVSPSGVKFKFKTDGYYQYIIDSGDDRCLVMSGPNSVWLANAVDGSLTCLSGDQMVVDTNVAYDTIYWINLDREVWAANWLEDNCKAKLFCEDAIAVSPFTDEAEGAVVEPERANWKGYGDIPIYSPYGE